MRCKNCGSILHFYVLDITGNSFYKCHTNLTVLGHRGQPRFVFCGTIHDNQGKVFNGFIAYNSEGKAQTVKVTNGQEG